MDGKEKGQTEPFELLRDDSLPPPTAAPAYTSLGDFANHSDLPELAELPGDCIPFRDACGDNARTEGILTSNFEDLTAELETLPLPAC